MPHYKSSVQAGATFCFSTTVSQDNYVYSTLYYHCYEEQFAHLMQLNRTDGTHAIWRSSWNLKQTTQLVGGYPGPKMPLSDQAINKH